MIDDTNAYINKKQLIVSETVRHRLKTACICELCTHLCMIIINASIGIPQPTSCARLLRWAIGNQIPQECRLCRPSNTTAVLSWQSRNITLLIKKLDPTRHSSSSHLSLSLNLPCFLFLSLSLVSLSLPLSLSFSFHLSPPLFSFLDNTHSYRSNLVAATYMYL